MKIKHKYVIQSVANANSPVPLHRVLGYADTEEAAIELATRSALITGSVHPNNTFVVYKAYKVIGFRTPPPIEEFEVE